MMLVAGHGMEWNGNFGMEFGGCQNGMENFKNGRQSSILNFVLCITIYIKKYTDVW